MLGLDDGAAAGTDWIDMAIVRFAVAYLSPSAFEVLLKAAWMRAKVSGLEVKVVVAQSMLQFIQSVGAVVRVDENGSL
jgi:hypothetical protein